MNESNPLVERVDALLKRHQQQAGAAGRAGSVGGSPSPAEPVAGASAAEVPFPIPPTLEAAMPPGAAPAWLGAESEDDIPVLTEVVEPDSQGATDAATRGYALAREIETGVLEKLLAELDLSLETRLNRAVGEAVEQAMDGLRADLSGHVRRLVRQAITEALAKQSQGRASSS